MQKPAHIPHYQVYNPAFGADYPHASRGPSAKLAPSGELWYVGGRGVTVLDLGELRTRRSEARAHIEGITVDGERYVGVTSLAPRTSRLRIDYTVVNLSSSGNRVQFRYRLDGFDTDWVDGTVPRQAYYTNLGPGTYRFRLQTSTNAVSWSDAESTWSFAIQPTFYQTKWFYCFCAIALIPCIVGGWRLRLHYVKKELAVVFGERIRLSREIHDTLLQGLVGLALQLEAASRSVQTSSLIRGRLAEMRGQVEDYIREARRSIWDLRSPSLDKHGFVGSLRDAGARLTAGKVQFVFKVTGASRSCPSRVELQALRIGQEAVINAVRHGKARQIRMEVRFTNDRLCLSIADDGQGFDAEALSIDRTTHCGLASMVERAADVGGTCYIQSHVGTGVNVHAEFPLAPRS
jgi:hypothetical protein